MLLGHTEHDKNEDAIQLSSNVYSLVCSKHVVTREIEFVMDGGLADHGIDWL